MPNPFVILSIDGGGIRGIIPAQVLVRVEKILSELAPKSSRLSQFFNLVAGTSTGGILACGILVPDDHDPKDSENSSKPSESSGLARSSEYSAEEMVKFYIDNGPAIFATNLYQKMRSGGGWTDEKYPSKPLEDALDNYFGDLLLSKLVSPCLITAYDITRRRAHFFRQHSGKNSSNFKVRDVCRATSAAPTFFEPANIKSVAEVPFPLIDGGVFANNPAMCAIAEAMNRFRQRLDRLYMLSIGTGSFKQSYDYEKAKSWGTGSWILPIIDMLMSSASETTHFQVSELFESVGKKENYLRIDTEFNADIQLHPKYDLDDCTAINLSKLKSFGRELADDQEDRIRRFLEKVLESRSDESVPDQGKHSVSIPNGEAAG